MAFNTQAAKQAGYTDQEIQDYLSKSGQQLGSPEQSNQGYQPHEVISSLLKGDLKGFGKDLVNNGNYALGNNLDENGNVTGVDRDRATNAALGFVGGGAALDSKSGAAVAGSTVKNLLGYLTKKGVGQKVGNKVAEATTKGASDLWNDFATEVRQGVSKRLGNDQPYNDIVNSRLAAESPASLEANPAISPQRLMDLRQQAAAREPQGIFSKFQGKSPSDQVDEIIRQVASGRLKDLAGTGFEDKLYSIYSKTGSPARLATSYGLGKLSDLILPEDLKGPTKDIGSGVGVEILRRVLGL